MSGKRVKLDSKFQPTKSGKRYDDDDDRMSELPDDILFIILSFVSLKEAARTSVLSSRWINLWKHTPCLKFDNFGADSYALNKIAEREKYGIFKKERRKYIKWVNCVVQSHKSPTLTEFKIRALLSRSNRNAITRWLEFAFARNVERLELDLLFGHFLYRPCDNYSFPDELFTRSSGSSDNLCVTPTDFKSLRALSLKYVNVSGEAVEFFIRNCPLLEKLVVHGTSKISNLEVCGSSLVLKHLELCRCFDIKSVKVSAPNLTSLVVDVLKGLMLVNVPMLVEVSVSNMTDSLKHIHPALACCISQLEILTLVHRPKLTENIEDYKHYQFQELPKLKKLVITCYPIGDESLIGLTSFLRASPYIEEFVLELRWSNFDELLRSDREVEYAMSIPHQHLKVFRFCGYYGRTSDIEFAKYIVENCVVLEKIFIDPSDQLLYHEPLHRDDVVESDAEQQNARSCAKQQLEGELPQHIELFIL